MENKNVGNYEVEKCEVEVEVVEEENTLRLTKPIMIDGEEVKVIQYDTSNLNGGSIERAIKDLAKRQIGVTVPEIDTVLHAQLFSYASKLDHTDIKRLCMKDYINATGIIRDFFIG